jgi:hypothetical protein
MEANRCMGKKAQWSREQKSFPAYNRFGQQPVELSVFSIIPTTFFFPFVCLQQIEAFASKLHKNATELFTGCG